MLCCRPLHQDIQNCTDIHTLFTYPCLHPIAPGPVFELEYENTATSVNIAWKPPKEPNGVIVAYSVEHGVYQNESTRNVNARRPTHIVIRALGKLLLLQILPAYSSKCMCQLLQGLA